MKPSKSILVILATLAASSIPLYAAPIELDLATNNPDPIALADSETSYTFSFSSFDIEYLIVAGGGGGGGSHDSANNTAGGGGGAGGLLEGTMQLSGGAQTITVGAGGVGGNGGSVGSSQPGSPGEDTIAFGFTALGGGFGGKFNTGGGDGGSGGGAASRSSSDGGAGGIALLDGAQGHDGGSRGSTSGSNGAPSGGGAGSAGIDNISNAAGRDGGDGVSRSITGVATVYAAGGGGGAGNNGTGGASATGGAGGDHGSNGSSAFDNTGGGGGGGAHTNKSGGQGGSGIVVVRYEGPQVLSGGDVSTDDLDTVHQFLDTGMSTLGFNATITGEISGEGSLEWDGGGTLTLTSTNTYTGETLVTEGTLLVIGSLDEASDVTVTGGLLGGTGTVGGSVTVGAEGGITPGASIGTLTIDGNLDVSAMAGAVGQFLFELGPIDTSDQVAVGGTLDIGTGALGFSDFDFTNVGGLEEGSYTLITSGTLTGTLDVDDLTGTIDGFDAELQTSGDNLILVLGEAPPVGGYAIWAETNAPTGGPGDDFDGDGVSNAIEYVLGGTATTNDLDKLPVATTDDGDLRFTFLRDPQALDGTTTVQIEVGTDLETWPTLYDVGATTATSSAGVTVEEDFEGTGLDKITLTIAQDPDDKKFARLKVTVGE